MRKVILVAANLLIPLRQGFRIENDKPVASAFGPSRFLATIRC